MLCLFEHAVDGLDDGRLLRNRAELVVKDSFPDDIQRHTLYGVKSNHGPRAGAGANQFVR